MLPSNSDYVCSHAKSLPVSLCSICTSATPESLVDLCFQYIVDHIETICEVGPFSKDFKLRDGLVIPVEICEKLLTMRQRGVTKLDNNFVSIFRDKLSTRLKRVKLRNTCIDDIGFKTIMRHKLVELDLSHCRKLTESSLKHIMNYGSAMTSLTIGYNVYILPIALSHDDIKEWVDRGYIILAPRLKKLTIKRINVSDPMFFHILVKPLTNLTHLDLSDCSVLGNLCFLIQLSSLTSLILYNVEGLQDAFVSICQLTKLRHLDISQSKERNGKYRNENQVLATIVERLPNLISLDISGTNLAGTGVAEFSPGKNRLLPASDIPGLSSRVQNPFQFLGLYGTSHGACQRHDIPAKMISGDANEEQILVAATAYSDRADVLQRVLNDLYHLFRFETSEHIGHALTVVLDSMDRHISEKHIQISGSATLFYIVKGKEKHAINVRVKRRIITALLNGMFSHKADETMMRNGCLTLCQFKIPQDVLFEYERLVNILLHSVYGMEQEGFVQRIGIYLLNSLACQVDGVQKQKLGDLGAISKMISLISERLRRRVCDDVLEVAWSTMWNVTDETPRNCHRFLEEKGMEYFLKCLDTFPDKEELLRNMMGLLGNVAEVKTLRPYLMTREYVSVFSELLDSCSDGIEVSYNAAGVISHMASDGAIAWTIKEPSRESVLKRMVSAIKRWDLNTERNINYRSFEPILYLVRTYDTPECQHWAVWALANLTKVYHRGSTDVNVSAAKYCSLVESEGGLVLLEELLQHVAPPFSVKQLAIIVMENCRQFREQDNLDSDSRLEG